MRYGSVCSGIEAASVAWHPLGWEASFVSEIEAFPRAVLQHRWPEIPLHGDFTTIEAGRYEPIDLLVGGTPCQSFSVAGLRGGLADDRGNLALEFLRLAQRTRPRWLVWENVPGVLSSAGGRDFGAILGGLVELGYGFAYRVLDAQFFGVAQRRRRVFVVGHLGDWRRAAAVLFERHSLSGHPAPRREAGKGTAVSPTLRAGGNRTGGDRPPGTDVDTCESLIAWQATGNSFWREGLGPLGASDDNGTNQLISHTLKGEGFDAGEDGTGRGTPIVPVSFTGGASECLSLEDMAHPVTGRHGDPGMVAFNITPSNSNKDYNARPSDRAQAVTAGGNRPSARGGDLIAGSAVRRLTPRECERLQGFADDYTLIPWRKGMAPDGPRYKALGNSMAVPVMAWIGRRIEAVEALGTQRAAA